MEFNLPTWTNTPETPITAEALNEMVEAIRYLYDNRSAIGDIIVSSTLDTMEKVIERYGGNEWEQLKDTFLLSAGDNHQVGESGGEENVTLTIKEMPLHSHGVKLAYGANDPMVGINYGNTLTGMAHDYGLIGDTGGNQPHNNMPPYLTVYMWKRIE